MSAMPSTDFDTNPPVPVTEYDHAVTSVNMGYEFIFERPGSRRWYRS